MDELKHTWIYYLERLDIAFQPIVSIHSGKIYGVEALLRGTDELGFDSIAAFFDEAYELNILYTIDLALREKVLQKFILLENYTAIKLFINIDNRLLAMPDYASGNTAKLLKKYKLCKDTICFEISEQHEISNPTLFEDILSHYKQENYSIAIDDFGVGVSGYQMLYRSTPDIIKIDRFFIESICKDIKKKIMVRSIVQLATQLGITIIAEGAETESEMLVCRELGCHLIQGYFVQRASLDVKSIVAQYLHVKSASKSDRRSHSNKKHIKTYVELVNPIYTSSSMNSVLERFKENNNAALPVVSKDGTPLGILDEKKMKELISSPYGRSVFLNESSEDTKIKKYVQKCAMVDIHTSIEQIIESFSNYKEAKGIIITSNMKYYGFLSASDIIEIINKRNLASAQDQNPLTKMAGNHKINLFINNAFHNKSNILFSYFDLNFFKAYNDTYGFRNGDRVIQLFANILQKGLPENCFSGHIGGDDFFIGIPLEKLGFEQAFEYVKSILQKFSDDVRSLYDVSDRERGYILAKDRDGKECKFELLSASAVVVELHNNSHTRTVDMIHLCFSSQKKAAKLASDHINVSTIL